MLGAPGASRMRLRMSLARAMGRGERASMFHDTRERRRERGRSRVTWCCALLEGMGVQRRVGWLKAERARQSLLVAMMALTPEKLDVSHCCRLGRFLTRMLKHDVSSCTDTRRAPRGRYPASGTDTRVSAAPPQLELRRARTGEPTAETDPAAAGSSGLGWFSLTHAIPVTCVPST